MENPNSLIRGATLWREFQAEYEEIQRHKWLESKKAGYDIGFDRALTDWIVKHRKKWRREREKQSFLGKIQDRGVNIEVFSDAKEFRHYRTLSATEYKSRSELVEIVGIYGFLYPDALRRTNERLTSPILGGVFANEYQDGNRNYYIHFHEDLDLIVNRDEKGELKIVT